VGLNLTMALDFIPLWGLFLGSIAFSTLAVEIGFRLGNRRSRSTTHESDAPLGTIVASTLGLLAFMLAFTFNIAVNRFEQRRCAVLDEANAIGTAYLRADFLEPLARDRVKKLFREYVSLRLQAGTMSLNEMMPPSAELQQSLWNEGISLSPKLNGSPCYALFMDSLNRVIDIHEERMSVGVYARVPLIVWSTLFFVALMSMIGVGYVCGLGRIRSVVPTLILTLTFGTVMYLVADLDRPRQGIIRTSQQPMIDLAKTIGLP
jgi:hypothetical protein